MQEMGTREEKILVLVRLRPLNEKEIAANEFADWECINKTTILYRNSLGEGSTFPSAYSFDRVFRGDNTTRQLYEEGIRELALSVVNGINSSVFAYGQTSSGKTYTMCGITDYAVADIFDYIHKHEERAFALKFSAIEIYNEVVRDLLSTDSAPLRLLDDPERGTIVEKMREETVQDQSHFNQLVVICEAQRQIGETSLNEKSSRSHQILRLTIESSAREFMGNDNSTALSASVNFVDLAGSERASQTSSTGARFKEGCHINRSLLTLGNVIRKLSKGRNGHITYRDSKLTRILQPALGGNARTAVICTLSPARSHVEQTKNTLLFACCAKEVITKAQVNVVMSDKALVKHLQKELARLENELKTPGPPPSNYDYAGLLKKKDLQIEKVVCSSHFSLKDQEMEREIRELTKQKDLAHSRIEELLQLINNDQDSQKMSGIGDEGEWRRRSTWEDNGSIPDEDEDIPSVNAFARLKSLESTLAGSMRRAQMTDTTIKQLEAEIEQLNRLVRQREEDCRRTKMMLKFREEKIQRMESLLGGSISSETYLHEENKYLSEEIQLLQAKVDKNPEVTRFALENIRLLDQLRRFQEFYEEGEREILLEEVARLRDELLQCMDGCPNLYHHPSPGIKSKDDTLSSKENASLHLELKNTSKELEECRLNLNTCLEENAILDRELHHLRSELDRLRFEDTLKDGNSNPESSLEDAQLKHAALAMKQAEDILNMQHELDIFRIMVEEERTSRSELEERLTSLSYDLKLTTEKFFSTTKLFEDATQELSEAKSIIEALESQQVLSINEVDDLLKSNDIYNKKLRKKETEIAALKKQLSRTTFADVEAVDLVEGKELLMQLRVKRMQESLDKARQLTKWNQNVHEQLSDEGEMEKIRKQAEGETAEVIVCMQEELAFLQKQVEDSQLKEIESKSSREALEAEVEDLHRNLDLVTEKNKELRCLLEERGGELKTLSEQCKILSRDIEELLTNGNEALEIASDELVHLSTFPQKRVWITEQFSQIIRTIYEKKLLIEELGGYLEDANCRRTYLECMLKSLRGAALEITEAHRQESSDKDREICSLRYELDRTACQISKLEEMVELMELNLQNASNCATAAFVVVNRVSEVNLEYLRELKEKDKLPNDHSHTTNRKLQCTGASYSSQGGEQEAKDLPGFESNSGIRLSNKQETCLAQTVDSTVDEECPFFEVVISKCTAEGKYLHVPDGFSRSHLRKARASKATLNLIERSWQIELIDYERSYRMARGWGQFARDNYLRIGDICSFKLIDKIKFVFEVSITKHLHEHSRDFNEPG